MLPTTKEIVHTKGSIRKVPLLTDVSPRFFQIYLNTITGKVDLIFFDLPYYIKEKKAYREKATEEAPSISSYSKESYEKFIESFCILAHKNTGETTRIAFLNADWRDFESTPASKEKPDRSITMFINYHSLCL